MSAPANGMKRSGCRARQRGDRLVGDEPHAACRGLVEPGDQAAADPGRVEVLDDLLVGALERRGVGGELLGVTGCLVNTSRYCSCSTGKPARRSAIVSREGTIGAHMSITGIIGATVPERSSPASLQHGAEGGI